MSERNQLLAHRPSAPELGRMIISQLIWRQPVSKHATWLKDYLSAATCWSRPGSVTRVDLHRVERRGITRSLPQLGEVECIGQRDVPYMPCINVLNQLRVDIEA